MGICLTSLAHIRSRYSSKHLPEGEIHKSPGTTTTRRIQPPDSKAVTKGTSPPCQFQSLHKTGLQLLT